MLNTLPKSKYLLSFLVYPAHKSVNNNENVWPWEYLLGSNVSPGDIGPLILARALHPTVEKGMIYNRVFGAPHDIRSLR